MNDDIYIQIAVQFSSVTVASYSLWPAPAKWGMQLAYSRIFIVVIRKEAAKSYLNSMLRFSHVRQYYEFYQSLIHTLSFVFTHSLISKRAWGQTVAIICHVVVWCFVHLTASRSRFGRYFSVTSLPKSSAADSDCTWLLEAICSSGEECD